MGQWDDDGQGGFSALIVSHIVSMGTGTDYRAQNNNAGIPSDWSAPWAWSTTIRVDGSVGGGSTLVFATGLPLTTPQAAQVILTWAAGDALLGQISTIFLYGPTTFNSNGPPVAFPNATEVVVKFEWTGTEYRLYFDATLILTLTDAAINSNQGIDYEWHNSAGNDNKRIYRMEIEH